MTEPDYIVLRPGETFDGKDVPNGINGSWYDKSQIPVYCDRIETTYWVAEPTNQFETRDDGAVAEIWEVNIK